MKFFILSDIHSFYDAMMAALEKQGFDIFNPDHNVVICGDLFDRGPDAVKVFKFVSALAEQGRLVYICGNHEELLFDCVNDIRKRSVSSHHVSNGTLDTVMQFTGMSEYDLLAPWCDYNLLNEKMHPVLDFITENAIDYAIIGDYICVHGWVPCYTKEKSFSLSVYDDIFDDELFENIDRWRGARWVNGMAAWSRGARIDDKTIICGHWHASWGHSHLHQDRKEFPAKNRKDWQKSFEPFVDEGIIALDACTVYSGFCNCWVIEF